MIDEAERVLEAFEDGRVGRREAVTRLAAWAAATAVAATGLARAAPAPEAESGGRSGTAPTFRVRGLNHIALSVTDVARSREFYVRHLGARVTSESDSSCFLDVGDGHFLALFRSDAAAMDHYCYTLDGYDPDDVVARLRAAGIEPRRRGNRVYFDDPDGLEVQLAAP